MVTLRYFRLKGAKRIALLASNDSTGQDTEFAVNKALTAPENRDLVKVADERVNNGDWSASAQVAKIKVAKIKAAKIKAAKIKAANPDVVLVWVIGPSFQTIMRSIKEIGLDVPIAANTANYTNPQNELVASYGIPIYWPSFRYFTRDGLTRGPLKAEIDTFYRSADAAGVNPDVIFGNVWDSGRLVVAAFRALGTNATAEQVKKFIDTQRSFSGINGVYNFEATPQRGLNETGMVMTLWDPKSARVRLVSKPAGVPL